MASVCLPRSTRRSTTPDLRRARTDALVLGLDLGSTEVRAGLFDLQGQAIQIARRGHPTRRDPDGAAEQDTAGWWDAVRGAVTDLGSARVRAAAVCAVGQGPTLVPVDADGLGTHPAVTWMDTRPARHVAGDSDGVAGFSLQPAIRWFADREPAALSRTRWLLNSWDWLAVRLCGVAVSSIGPGEERLVVPDAGDRIGPGVPVGHDLGPILGHVADALGLAPDTRVISGTNDGTATFVGAALRTPGDAVDVGGASGGVAILASGPRDLPGIYCAPSLLPGRWILGGAMMSIGASLDWLRSDVLGDRWSTDELLAEAGAVAPGANGLVFLPYLAGERSPIWDDEARGVFCGLRRDHTRGHLVRAVLEGGAFALRDVITPILDAGVPVRELRLAGRQARSRVWGQIKSDVLGVPTVVPTVLDAGLLGAATIAAVGAGLLADLEDAAATMHHERERFVPRPETQATYDALFTIYRRLYPALRETFHDLGRI